MARGLRFTEAEVRALLKASTARLLGRQARSAANSPARPGIDGELVTDVSHSLMWPPVDSRPPQERGGDKPARRSKYNSRRVTVDGETFDSQWEADYYQTLLWSQKAGEIRDLRRQVPLPVYFEGKKLGRHRLVVDFTFWDMRQLRTRWLDTKGMTTREWQLKRLLIEQHYGISIEIVRRTA